MIDNLTPEEQIQRVARCLLAAADHGRPARRGDARPDLRGLIAMIDRHLEGRLPPLRVVPDRDPSPFPRRPRVPARG